MISADGVLNVVAANDVICPTEIADALDLVPSSVSRHLQVLAEDGVVTLQRQPGRPSLVAHLDHDAGRAALNRFEPAAWLRRARSSRAGRDPRLSTSRRPSFA